MIWAIRAPAAWMSANGLRLGLTKTQYIHVWLGRRQQFAKFNLTAIASNFPNKYHFKFSVTVSDLGLRATLDQELTFAPQSLHPLPMLRQLYLTFPLPSPPPDRLSPLLLPLLTIPFITAR